MICGFYINELAKHVGVRPAQKTTPMNLIGYGKERTNGMKKLILPFTAIFTAVFVLTAFGVMTTQALADPGGGQVVAIQKADLTTAPPDVVTTAINANTQAGQTLTTANTATPNNTATIALDTSPPIILAANNNNANITSAPTAIDTSPPITITANGNNTTTATFNTKANLSQANSTANSTSQPATAVVNNHSARNGPTDNQTALNQINANTTATASAQANTAEVDVVFLHTANHTAEAGTSPIAIS